MYATGVDADIIVWIAPQFNDEHRDAIQWLNDNSREGIDLFAIRLEVWKISESNPAVRFNPVEQPSEWKDRARGAKNELSEREERPRSSGPRFETRFRKRKHHSSHEHPVLVGNPDPK